MVFMAGTNVFTAGLVLGIIKLILRRSILAGQVKSSYNSW